MVVFYRGINWNVYYFCDDIQIVRNERHAKYYIVRNNKCVQLKFPSFPLLKINSNGQEERVI